ncbi:tape measure protein [Acinetobacter pollinis]|uniref:tape measure protein n=1 Tax=Acinetobacter pollinis TaxID=2605270 RepID=UPI0018C24D66|nr:tape measure protein [Acinetobacter pollinis]MBF7694154.1 tape measure protein [Acinetobacter pollinis]MBF7701734.1 tape measure protein [Acinetobacter pollinis]
MAEAKSRLVIEISAENAKRNADALSVALGNVEKTGNIATNSINQLGKNAKDSSQSLGVLADSAKRLIGVMGGYITLSEAIKKSDDYAGLQNRLKLVTHSQSELNEAMTDTFKIAQSTRQSWDSAAQVYQGFAKNAQALGLNLKQVASITNTVSKAVAISGSSAQASEAALVQFNQALSGGVLRGEDLNSVLEQAPGLADALEKGLGLASGQLRKIAATGAITSDAIVKALTKASGYVDDLFSKTDPTISQSFQILSNEVTKFVGESGQASGSAKLLSGTIQGLANNLNLVTNGLMIGGAYWLGTYIPAIYHSINAQRQKIAGLVSEIKTQQIAIEVDSQRASRIAHLTAVELANAEATAARMTGVTRLAYIEKSVLPLRAANVAAIEADTIAQTANNAAKMTATRLGTGLLGVLGGPVGLGLTIAGVATSYLLMKSSADSANEKLEEQSKTASKTKDELLALQGVQKKGAINDLKDSFVAQNKALKDSNYIFNGHIIDLQNTYSFSAKVADISDKVRLGTMSQSDAIRELNKLNYITPEQLSQLQKDNAAYEEKRKTVSATSEALDYFGIKVELAGNKSQNAAPLIDKNTNALDQNAIAANNAAMAQKGFFDKLNTESNIDRFKYSLLSSGFSQEATEKIAELYKAKQDVAPKGTTAIITSQEIQDISKSTDLLKAIKDKQDDLKKIEQEKTKEKERQVKLDIQSNDQQVRGVQIVQAYLKAGLGKTQALALAAQVGREGDFLDKNLFGTHKDEKNHLTNVGMLSFQGSRATDFMRYMRSKDQVNDDGTIKPTQASLDAQALYSVNEIMTNKSYKKTKEAISNPSLQYDQLSPILGDNYVRWNSTGGGKNGIGIEKANAAKAKERNYFNSLQGIFNRNGDSSDIDVSKIGPDEEKLYQIKLQIAEKFYTKDQKLQQDHDKELRDIRLIYTGSEQTEKLKQSESQFQNQKKLNDLQCEQSVNGWAWVGEQKITKDAEVKKAIIDSTIDLTDKQKELAKKGIDDQANYEINTFRKTQALKVQDLQTKINQQLGKAQAGALDTQAKKRLTSNQYESWNLQNQYSDELSTASDDHDKNIRDINETDDKGHYKIADTQKRQELIMQAHEAYEARKFEITEKYTQKANDLSTAQTSEQLSAYGTMFGGMATLVKGFAGESSGAYKTMLAAQKAANLASAIMSGYTAISAAWGSAPFPANLPAVAAATVKTGVLQAGIEAVSVGFSDGGYTGPGGKHDVAGVVHAGEVVFSQADVARLGGVGAVEGIRKGIKGYSDGGVVGGVSSSISSQLSSNSSQSQGNVNIQQSITIADGQVTTNTKGQKQIAESLNNAMNAWARRESMQGGVLYRLVRSK